MNRDHYLSKRSQSPLQKPADRQVVPEDKADAEASAEPDGSPAAPDMNAEHTAGQETQSGR